MFQNGSIYKIIAFKAKKCLYPTHAGLKQRKSLYKCSPALARVCVNYVSLNQTKMINSLYVFLDLMLKQLQAGNFNLKLNGKQLFLFETRWEHLFVFESKWKQLFV